MLKGECGESSHEVDPSCRSWIVSRCHVLGKGRLHLGLDNRGSAQVVRSSRMSCISDHRVE